MGGTHGRNGIGGTSQDCELGKRNNQVMAPFRLGGDCGSSGMDLQAANVREVCTRRLLLGTNAQSIQARFDGVRNVCYDKKEGIRNFVNAIKLSVATRLFFPYHSDASLKLALRHFKGRILASGVCWCDSSRQCVKLMRWRKLSRMVDRQSTSLL